MASKFIWLLLLHFTLSILACLAQTEPEVLLAELISAVADDLPEDFDYTEFHETLLKYQREPIDLNRTNGDELRQLLFITPQQVEFILRHRAENGAFIDLLELQSIDGLDVSMIKKLLLFVRIKPRLIEIEPIRLTFRGAGEMLIRYGQILQQQAGYRAGNGKDPAYAGSPAKILFRYKQSFGRKIGFAVVFQKDAGETLGSKLLHPKIDLSSLNLNYNGQGAVKKIVAGNYALQFGQGLTMWSGLSLGKGGVISTIPRQGIGLKPASGSSNLMALRGGGATIQSGRISLTPFVSFLKLDASLVPNPATGIDEVTSVDFSGLHRTTGEIEKKSRLFEQIYGSNITYRHHNLVAGGIVFATLFNHPFQKSNDVYNAFDFQSNRLINIGIFYNYSIRNVYLFGEAAHSLNSGYGFTNGIIASLSPVISLVVLHRNFQRNYHNFFNQAIAESGPVNEEGLYTGISFNPINKLAINAYADRFRFPWLKYRADAPSAGFELYGQLTYDYRKKVNIDIRYKYKVKEENELDGGSLNILEHVIKRNVRIEVSTLVKPYLDLRSRLEIVHFQKAAHLAEPGYLIYQDVFYRPSSSRWAGNIRFAVFNSRSFNSRIYAYEQDVLFSYSNLAFQDSGARFYVNARCNIKPGLDLWMRYARHSICKQRSDREWTRTNSGACKI